MFPWMIEMIMVVVATCIVTNPAAIIMHVRGFWVALIIGEAADRFFGQSLFGHVGQAGRRDVDRRRAGLAGHLDNANQEQLWDVVLAHALECIRHLLVVRRAAADHHVDHPRVDHPRADQPRAGRPAVDPHHDHAALTTARYLALA